MRNRLNEKSLRIKILPNCDGTNCSAKLVIEWDCINMLNSTRFTKPEIASVVISVCSHTMPKLEKILGAEYFANDRRCALCGHSQAEHDYSLSMCKHGKCTCSVYVMDIPLGKSLESEIEKDKALDGISELASNLFQEDSGELHF